MVKTDGGSNMVANTFFNNIPGWDEDEEEDEVTPDTPSSLTDENSPDDMVEMEISEEDPLWDLLQEAGLSFNSVTAEEEELEEIEIPLKKLCRHRPPSPLLKKKIGLI